MSFNNIVRERRKELKITQRELANRVGVDFTYISKIENDVLLPSEGIIKKICSVLKLDFVDAMLKAMKIPKEFKELIFSNKEIVDYLKSKVK